MFSLRFFRQEDRWYADVPGHTLEDNEMVMGADSFLEMMASGGECTVEFECTRPETYMTGFKLKSHDAEGAWYFNIESPMQQIWLCNVVHDVCGEHPEEIYITGIGV